MAMAGSIGPVPDGYHPGMQAQRIDDPMAFRVAAMDLLLADEARHNLMLGLTGTLCDHPETHPEHHQWIVSEGAEVVHVALMTPPFPICVARPRAEGALEILADAVMGEGIPVPGVEGAHPESAQFAEIWGRRTGITPVVNTREGIFALTQVRPVPRPSGGARSGAAGDRLLLLDWFQAFLEEAVPNHPGDHESLERSLDSRLRNDGSGGIWLWEDGGVPVSMAGFAGPTPNGMRVGPVYTPPALRGRGYATSLVAEMSAWLLAGGRTSCFLYTDLSNPTSNAIYERIGYRKVGEAANIRFDL